MKRRLARYWMALILAPFLVSLLVLPTEAAPAKVYEWKFQTNKTPGSPFFNDEKRWVDWINANSGGRLKITLFPAGQIVKVDDYITARKAAKAAGDYKELRLATQDHLERIGATLKPPTSIARRG